MNPRTYLSVFGVLGLLYGLIFLLVPTISLPMYGLQPDVSGVEMARYFGVTLVGAAAIDWLCRKGRDAAMMRGLLTGNLLMGLIGAGVALREVLLGIGGPLIWSTVLVYACMTIGAVVCLRGEPSMAFARG